MKDLLLPLALLPTLPIFATVNVEDVGFWERLLEKWGIGLVGLGLFFLLAKWTAQREAALLTIRLKREDELNAAKAKREEADNAERSGLLRRNNELQELAIASHKQHADELKRIIKDGNKYQEDVGRELKNLARRVRCPGTTPPPEESTS